MSKKRRKLTAHERLHWRYKIQSNQKGVVRYAIFRYVKTVSPQKYVRIKTPSELRGVQVENRFYYVRNGVIKYCWINQEGNRILYIYDRTPKWANEQLIRLYEAKKAELAERESEAESEEERYIETVAANRNGKE